MYKTILILLCALFTLLEPQAVQAAPTDYAVGEAELVEKSTPRPNYKPYRGNSRHKAKKLGIFKRWSLRRKAMRKRKHKAIPSVKVDKPMRNK